MLEAKNLKRGLRNVIIDGVTSQSMVTLSSGAFLAAFALSLGASNALIGVLAAIPPIAQLFQLPSILLVDRWRKRRIITMLSSLFSRLFLLQIAAIPLLFTGKLALSVLVLAITLQSVFGAVSGCSWNSWMRDLVPEEQLGSFFSKRMSIALAVGIPLSVLAALGIDYWKSHYQSLEIYGYSIIFSAGFLFGLLGVIVISLIPEPSMPEAGERPRLLELILEPFQNETYRKLIHFLGSWNFAVNLAAPFFTVYMIKRLQFDLSWVIGFTVLSQIVHVLFLRVWGRYTDRFSNKSVLLASGPLFIFCILAWPFTTIPERYFLTIPLLLIIHILMGVAAAGVTLATGNIGLKLAPAGKATSYLAANSVVNSLSAFVGPILGGLFADFFAERELALNLHWHAPGRDITVQTLNFQQWDFFFFFAFLVGLYSLHRLTSVKEVGEVSEKIVIKELIGEVGQRIRSISTIPGIRHLIQFPFFLIRKMGSNASRKASNRRPS
jgi:MFS family permease